MWIDWYREDLHRVYADVEVPTLISLPRDFGEGPLAIHSDLLPEQHSFRGKAGGMAVFPLWLPGDGRPDNGRTVVNGRRCGFTDSVLEWSDSVFPDSLDLAQDTYDYVLALLSSPLYAERYWPELEAVSPRVPLVQDQGVAEKTLGLGRQVRAAWRRDAPTHGLKWEGAGSGALGPAALHGDVLRFANGRTILGIPSGAWEFKVSGYRVLAEWFAAREHWVVTIAQAQEALQTIASIGALIRLEPELSSLFAEVDWTQPANDGR